MPYNRKGTKKERRRENGKRKPRIQWPSHGHQTLPIWPMVLFLVEMAKHLETVLLGCERPTDALKTYGQMSTSFLYSQTWLCHLKSNCSIIYLIFIGWLYT